MPIPDLATPANQLFHTLDESPQRKSAKILNIQVQEINSSPDPKWNQSPPSFATASNSQDTGKRLTNLSAFRCPLTSLSNILPTVNEAILRNHRGSSQFFLLKVWRNICQIEDESLPVLKDIRALLSVFNTTTKRSLCLGALSSVQFSSVAQSCPILCDPMNRSTPGLPVHHQLPDFTQKIVGISNELQLIPVFESIPFCLSHLRDTHPFPFSFSAQTHLLDWSFLRKVSCQNFFLPKGK